MRFTQKEWKNDSDSIWSSDRILIYHICEHSISSVYTSQGKFIINAKHTQQSISKMICIDFDAF